MKEIDIGLFGAPVNNANLGCQALTYSVIDVLIRMCNRNNVHPKFHIFEFNPNETKKKMLCEKLGISVENVEVHKFQILRNFKHCIKHPLQSIKFICQMRNCDFIIDLTEGDSFTDIYGHDRFYNLSFNKKIIEKMGIPFVLGPQTYGPFNDAKIKKYAKKIIEGAELVISRDEMSSEFIHSFCNKHIVIGTDLAFGLPYQASKVTHNDKVLIGINPSGLLVSKKIEATDLVNTNTVDYDKYLNLLINKLRSNNRVELHLISHVSDEAYETIGDINGVICHRAFSNPIDVKNLIASMDIFIGARMHATIAAFSSGVATIPNAYSRKFSGLYSTIGYNRVIDLQSMTTEKALEITYTYIKDYVKLKQEVNKCRGHIQERYEFMEETLSNYIENLLRRL